MRIGFGFDSHRLVEGRKLILSGVEIPYPEGLVGHSDGDVVLHAVCDALLGAAGLGDIGEHFPDTSAAFAGARSSLFLERSLEMLRDAGLRPSSLDITIIADAPKLQQWKAAMRKNLARMLGMEEQRISVKAKTAEALALSSGAVIAQAVVLVEEPSDVGRR